MGEDKWVGVILRSLPLNADEPGIRLKINSLAHADLEKSMVAKIKNDEQSLK